MRLIIRILWHAFAAVSLVVCLAVVGLWVRSYCKSEAFGRNVYLIEAGEYRADTICEHRGRVEVNVWRAKFDPELVAGAKVKEDAQGGEVFFSGGGQMKYQTGWVRRTRAPSWGPAMHWWERWGVFVRWDRGWRAPGYHAMQSEVTVIGSYWILVVLSAIWPGLWIVAWWRGRKFPQGNCQRCGYDLRASEGRCPECGAEAGKGLSAEG